MKMYLDLQFLFSIISIGTRKRKFRLTPFWVFFHILLSPFIWFPDCIVLAGHKNSVYQFIQFFSLSTSVYVYSVDHLFFYALPNSRNLRFWRMPKHCWSRICSVYHESLSYFFYHFCPDLVWGPWFLVFCHTNSEVSVQLKLLEYLLLLGNTFIKNVFPQQVKLTENHNHIVWSQCQINVI